MAFRLSQKTFGQVLKTQTRSLSTSSPSILRSSVALRVAAAAPSCSRSTFAKAFSTSRITFNSEVEAKAAPSEDAARANGRPEGTLQHGGKTVFFGNLPFYTEKDKFEDLLKEFGEFETVRWANSKTKAPICFVTFNDAANASALVDSSLQEPFYYGGRQLRVHLAVDRPGYSAESDNRRRDNRRGEPMKFPPSPRVYFKDFTGGLEELKDWLGEHALNVNNARFAIDKETGAKRNLGLIMFQNTEQATACIRDKKNARGPDGTPVYMRFANAQTLEQRQRSEQRQPEPPKLD